MATTTRPDEDFNDQMLVLGAEDDAKDEQHPKTPSGLYMAHCTRCGTYTHDTTEDPGLDYLCRETTCQYDEDGSCPWPAT